MPPPEKLFIYEIEGRVYPPDDLTGEDFLGCWREGNYSYLFFPRPMEAAVKAWVATQEGARYSSENVMNYADWEAGQPLQIYHGGVSPLPGVGDAVSGSRRDRHPHGAGPGLRLRVETRRQ